MTGHRDAPRLRVAVIGVGRVGSVLAAALAQAGHRVVAGTGVSRESTRGPPGCCPALR